ncbi:hypothetical protein Poli38472_006574 [Pythium oligandrum]|uniref:Oxidation resistance protein 1 n=1 Tax=Pythium oligandrum TaxID=41045 RepID=A0A8K1FD67_PYTOL|nr:hypothetical protein Poli38472_006574 [Pythium oligandrum]|eukprot:TMW56564.1 hypothetical protein Poli38472_006574 [Pythium oligandrum]
MLSRVTQWLATKLEYKEDDHLRTRFDALTRMKKATLDLLNVLEERSTADNEGDEGGDGLAQTATGYLASIASSRVVLTEEDQCVHDFGAALENCLKLGIKGQNDRDLSWWQVLYTSTLMVDDPTLVQTIQTAGTMSETEVGKARCWMKLALNNRTIESSIAIICSQSCEPVVRANYEDWALVRCIEGLDIFMQMIADIRDVRFCIRVDEEPFRLPIAKEVPTIPIPGAGAESAKAEGDAFAATTTSTLAPTTPTATSASLPISPSPSDVTVSADKLGQPETAGHPLIPDDDFFVEVSAVVFPHRHKGIKPWQHVFGVSIAYLAKNPYHSRFALIDPVLSIPNIVQDCIDILYENPNTPRLFRTTVLNVTVSQLREIVENEGMLPADLDAHGAGALLLDFFKNLPESLLTTEKYEAFIASGRIKEEDACIRNIACLVQNLPVHCKFVLEKVIAVMHFLQLPEHSVHNGLDVGLASTMLAPVIAFKSETKTTPAGQRKMSHPQHHDVRFAAIGAQVVERMIVHHDEIFQEVRIQVSDSLQRLETKKQALLSIYQLYKMKPQVNFFSDRLHLDEISDIFVESVKSKESLSAESPPNNFDRIPPPVLRMKIGSPLKHRASSPNLYEGVLSSSSAQGVPIPSLGYAGSRTGSGTYMVKNDSTMLLDRLYNRALPTVISSYDAGLVSSAICKSLINLLKLVPLPENPTINIVALSVEPFWELFDEEAYFFKLFLLVFQIFDQLWNSLSPDEASFTRVFCDTESKVDELLKKSPSSVEDLRSEWEGMWRQMNEEEEGSTEEESTTTQNATAAPPSPPRLCKKPSFTFRPEDYKNKLLDPSNILTVDHIAFIDHAVPLTCQLCRWCLLYSTDMHGSSLHTLLMMTKNQSPTLIVVKDDQDNIFGGFGSDEWHRSTQYFGNGETFLFTFSPRAGVPTAHSGTVGSHFVKYPWSRRNNYFMLCSEESLVMGGGGSFGLYLDSDLSRGTTGPCETFSSRPLVPSHEFNCVHVEVWGFTTSDKHPTANKEKKRRSVLD